MDPPSPRAVGKNKARVEEIKQILEDRRNGRTKGSSEQQGLKSKLAELRAQFQAVLVRDDRNCRSTQCCTPCVPSPPRRQAPPPRALISPPRRLLPSSP